MLNKKILTVALVFLAVVGIFEGIGKVSVRCEDQADEETEEAVVDTEGEVVAEETEQESQDSENKGSPEADTVIIFTNPIGSGKELPAGKPAEFVVGFKNGGDRDFIIDSLACSFRYPMDFSYYIQNFSALTSERVVKPKQEATLLYSFTPAEAFAGRPLGLVVNLAYHHVDGIDYEEAVFNQTISIVEVDEGFDGETFFLYIFLLALSILLLLALHHFFVNYGRKSIEPTKKTVIETGTNMKDGVDYDWIPKELLNQYSSNGSPRQSPRNREKTKQSPRSRK